MGTTSRYASLDAPAASGIIWEEKDCLLCGSAAWTPLVEAPDPTPGGAGQWFMVVQCKDCGLCYTNPRPSSDSIQQFYPPGYVPHQSRVAAAERSWWRPIWPGRATGRRWLRLQGEGRLLDFGCGGGAYLLRMRRQGWRVAGIDTSAEVVERLRTTFGLSVLHGSLPHPELPEESFDVVTMWHSLEHVHEPLTVLRGAYRVLTPQGRLIVAVPNMDSAAFRWFGQAWNGLDLPRHLVHFAPWSLQLMLHRVGFRRVSIRMQRRSSWLRASARLAARLQPRLAWSLRVLQGRLAANLASWYAFVTRQSDCMIAQASKT
ncbi:MAG: class I SAM-dependent methyltransferase [Gemmataceae bacterium]|nr:class I SAM-dependent methyltransferase [Gemmataceae bacterium]